jgi:phenylalanyl-tRNA synthetase alpha subunit
MTNTHTNQEKGQHRLGFDTHKAVKKIFSKGIKPDVAEAIVETIQEVVTASYENLATKQELNEVKQEIKQEIKEVKQELKQEIKEVKQELKQEIQEVRQEIKQASCEQKLYANKMAVSMIVGAPAFYAGLEFLIKFLAK